MLHAQLLSAPFLLLCPRRFKCAPPLRERENLERLWEGVADGTIDSMATDHSPSPPSLKLMDTGDFIGAWGGISGLQYALPATWHGMQQRNMSLPLLSRLWSEAPARIAGLGAFKGRLMQGYDADIVIFDPEAKADTGEAALYHRHKTTPYAGMKLNGKVLATFVRGQQVFSVEGGVAMGVCGKVLKR